jgi:hypothetical protein
MIGKRVDWHSQILNPGEYAKDSEGTWRCSTPNGHQGNLKLHDVTENEDGTITVSPSILVSSDRELWHGYLERGVWRGVGPWGVV